MPFCVKCGKELSVGDFFCGRCGTQVPEEIKHEKEYQQPEKKNTVVSEPQYSSEVSNQREFIGRFVGQKRFLKIPYRLYATDIYTENSVLIICQGSGFASARPDQESQIDFNTIASIEAKNCYNASNTVFAICGMLFGLLLMGSELFMSAIGWLLITTCAITFLAGKSVIVRIHHRSGVYEIPTEFISDAQDLKNKLENAISQRSRS